MTEQEANKTAKFIESTMCDNIIITENKKLMCPECFEISEAKIVSTVSTAIEMKGAITIERPKIRTKTSLNHTISGYCTHCKQYISSFTVLDNDIADIISDLNKLGYITKYSCQGHLKNEFGYISLPYIIFNGSYTNEVLRLPENWVIDKLYSGGSGTTKTDTKIEPKHGYRLHFEEYWKDLREWVSKLG